MRLPLTPPWPAAPVSTRYHSANIASDAHKSRDRRRSIVGPSTGSLERLIKFVVQANSHDMVDEIRVLGDDSERPYTGGARQRDHRIE